MDASFAIFHSVFVVPTCSAWFAIVAVVSMNAGTARERKKAVVVRLKFVAGDDVFLKAHTAPPCSLSWLGQRSAKYASCFSRIWQRINIRESIVPTDSNFI